MREREVEQDRAARVVRGAVDAIVDPERFLVAGDRSAVIAAFERDRGETLQRDHALRVIGMMLREQLARALEQRLRANEVAGAHPRDRGVRQREPEPALVLETVALEDLDRARES